MAPQPIPWHHSRFRGTTADSLKLPTLRPSCRKQTFQCPSQSTASGWPVRRTACQSHRHDCRYRPTRPRSESPRKHSSAAHFQCMHTTKGACGAAHASTIGACDTALVNTSARWAYDSLQAP
eukprot:366181-Chlamydomonas_euryale.AAC.8